MRAEAAAGAVAVEDVLQEAAMPAEATEKASVAVEREKVAGGLVSPLEAVAAVVGVRQIRRPAVW
jgi:hypothetical protein